MTIPFIVWYMDRYDGEVDAVDVDEYGPHWFGFGPKQDLTRPLVVP